MARKFFYVCAGMFLLALSYQFGASTATAQAPGSRAMAGDTTGMDPLPGGVNREIWFAVLAKFPRDSAEFAALMRRLGLVETSPGYFDFSRVGAEVRPLGAEGGLLGASYDAKSRSIRIHYQPERGERMPDVVVGSLASKATETYVRAPQVIVYRLPLKEPGVTGYNEVGVSIKDGSWASTSSFIQARSAAVKQ